MIISVSLPDTLVKKLDELVKKRGYYSRSEVIRDALRSLITEIELRSGEFEKMAGVIMATCEFERRDVDLRMTKIRHDFNDVVVENIHRHIEEKYCVEIFIVEGETSRILTLLSKLRGIHGIYQVKSILLPL